MLELHSPVSPRPAPMRVVLAMLLWAALGGAFASSPAPPVVAVLHSYHQGLPWSDEVQRGLVDGLGSGPSAATVFVDYLDAIRLPVQGELDARARFERWVERLGQVKPDVVVAVDNLAFELFMAHRARVFPGLPMVFAGVNNFDPASIDGALAIAGVAEAPSFADTLSLIAKLRPAAARLHLLGDSSATFAANRRALEAANRALPRPFELVVHVPSSIEEAEAVAGRIAPGDAMFLAARLADSAGRLLPDAELANRISARSTVPVFSCWAFFLGHGIVGGRVVAGEFQGREAARLALELLAAKPALDVATVMHSPNPYAFDWRQLQRWELDDVDLPTDALVLNRPEPLHKTHPRLFVAGGVGGSLLLLLAMFLAVYANQRRIGEGRLRESELMFRNLFDNVSTGIALHALDGRFLRANAPLLRTLGVDESTLLLRHLCDLFEPRDWTRFEPLVRRVVESGSGKAHMELPLALGRPSGWASVSLSIGRDAKGGAAYLISALEDITERKQTEARLQQSGAALESTSEAVMVTDPDERIIAVNRAFTKILGYEEADVLGRSPGLLLSDRHGADFQESVWNVLIRDGRWQGELWNRRKDGTLVPTWTSISEIVDPNGEIGSYVSVISDISAIKASQAELERMAAHDALTGLPNRLLLDARLEQALSSARRDGGRVAVLFLDLDRFKAINDSLGHQVGDALLKEVAVRLTRAVREGDTVARLGGDEFVVVVECGSQADAAEVVARKVIACISSPLELPGLPSGTRIGVSVGIALHPSDGVDAGTLLRNADTAMYRAKEAGRGQFRHYSEEMGASAVDRFMLESELRTALASDQIEVHFQPLVRLSGRRTYGAEALVRWRHPQRGLVFPDRFIPVAEECGLIVELGRQVLEQACHFAVGLIRQGHAFERIAVNLSPAELVRDDFVASVAAVLERTGLPAGVLELEITENFAMSEAPDMIERLFEVSALGVALAVDDFGTGYSNLGQLKRLPIGKLKIDRSFVEALPDDPNDLAITRTVIALGHTLGFGVIAEGIETEAQAAVLLREGCLDGQGYLFSRPLSQQAFVEFLAAEAGATASATA